MRAFVTGAAGLLGRAVCKKLRSMDWEVIGIDNLSRYKMFGLRPDPKAAEPPDAKTLRVIDFADTDYRDADVIVHTAAQTSHPRSISIPDTDFMVNAQKTFNLLMRLREMKRRPKLVYISTAKVYGENVDKLVPYDELDTRFEYADRCSGVSETCPIGDQTLLTPFGVSKLAADLYCQQFAKLYGMPITILRPGCFTGPINSAVEEQNWLPILVRRLLRGESFSVFGYGGKQVRCLLHADDLADAVVAAIEKAAFHGEVYNVGGGRGNEISILEAVEYVRVETHAIPIIRHEAQREGDWCCYIGDNAKAYRELEWFPKIPLAEIVNQVIAAEKRALECPL